MLTAPEQYFLEQLNRARLNPEGEAARFGIGLNDPDPTNASDQPPFTPIESGVRQPLAANAALSQAADLHSNAYLDGNVRTSGEGAGHWWIDDSSIYFQPPDRAEEFGYGSRFVGENLAYAASTGAFDAEQAMLWGTSGVAHHRGLFYSITHRPNLLNPDYKEAGIAQVVRDDHMIGDRTYTASTVTNKFGRVDPDSVFLTGVAYDDADGDGFYSLGEGVADVTVTVGAQGTDTAAAGGYALDLGAQPAPVSVTVDWQGQTLTALLGVSPDSTDNVKLDVVGGTRLMASGDLTLGDGVSEGGLLGARDLSLTGNAADNLLIVGHGDNTVEGGGGTDIVQFSGSFADYEISPPGMGGAQAVRDLRGSALGDGVNQLSDIAYLRFADGTYDMASAQFTPADPTASLTLDTPFGPYMSGDERNAGAILSGTTQDLPEGSLVTVQLGALTETVRSRSGAWQAGFSPEELQTLADGTDYTISASASGVTVQQGVTTTFAEPRIGFFPNPFDQPLDAADLDTGVSWRGVTSATDGEVAMTLAGTTHVAPIIPRQGDPDWSHEWEITFPEATLRALQDGASYTPTVRLTDQFDNAYQYTLNSFTADLDFPAPEPGDMTAVTIAAPGDVALDDVAVTFTPTQGAAQDPVLTEAGIARLDLGGATSGRITASRDYDPDAGDPAITALDALDVLRLAVGLAPSFGPAQAQNFIAADINADNSVTALDALEVLRAAVGLESTHAPRWAFFDAATDWEGTDASRSAVNAPDTGIDLSGIAPGEELAMTGILLGNMESV